jgi:hypothetical protein
MHKKIPDTIDMAVLEDIQRYELILSGILPSGKAEVLQIKTVSVSDRFCADF